MEALKINDRIKYEKISDYSIKQLEEMIITGWRTGRQISVLSNYDAQFFRKAAKNISERINNDSERKELAYYCMDCGI